MNITTEILKSCYLQNSPSERICVLTVCNIYKELGQVFNRYTYRFQSYLTILFYFGGHTQCYSGHMPGSVLRHIHDDVWGGGDVM